ncbi:hypothetical protein VTP01DRAFT_2443, partial [Rhizomucor pusillus]|uniref:uncharacterized protein n=1 Tax=Rhizomucor pusillus TaxID=4840 RepID=UPI00374454A0
MPQQSAQTVQQRLLTLAKTQQFAWFVGHSLTLLGSALYFLSFILFRPSVTAYKTAYVGAIGSYGVVIYKTHGVPKLSSTYAQRLVMDENVQYLLLALYWFLSRPITVTLIPFATFSTFHALGYIRTNIIPTVFPAPSNGGTWQGRVQQQIKAWTDKNYDAAMRFVAQIEVVVIMGRLLLGIFRLQIWSIFLYAQFLRFRFHLSTYTSRAFRQLGATLDRHLLPPTANPSIPPAVSEAYKTVKALVIRYGQAVVQPRPTQGQ